MNICVKLSPRVEGQAVRYILYICMWIEYSLRLFTRRGKTTLIATEILLILIATIRILAIVLNDALFILESNYAKYPEILLAYDRY